MSKYFREIGILYGDSRWRSVTSDCYLIHAGCDGRVWHIATPLNKVTKSVEKSMKNGQKRTETDKKGQCTDENGQIFVRFFQILTDHQCLLLIYSKKYFEKMLKFPRKSKFTEA